MLERTLLWTGLISIDRSDPGNKAYVEFESDRSLTTTYMNNVSDYGATHKNRRFSDVSKRPAGKVVS